MADPREGFRQGEAGPDFGVRIQTSDPHDSQNLVGTFCPFCPNIDIYMQGDTISFTRDIRKIPYIAMSKNP